MKIIYRISDAGYNKVKPTFINNENCLKNFCNIFYNSIYDISILADKCGEGTIKMIQKYIDPINIEKVSKGSGAETFNLALDQALKYEDDEIIYFVENDYLHKPGSEAIIKEGLDLGASFVTLYDHPDNYIDPSRGGNKYCKGGAEDTRVYLTQSSHWKITNSTTMTFAAKVKTLREVEPILRKHTTGTYPRDFDMFLELREKNHILISSIPGYSTHGETAWLSPLIDWKQYV
jgi:hypothetical protein